MPLKSFYSAWILFIVTISIIFGASDTNAQTRRAIVKKPAATAVKSGEKRLPELKLPDLTGAEWSLHKNLGRVILINFWATWCAPCRIETPGLVNVANEYKARGVEMVGVSMDEETSLIAPFVEKYAIPYQILLPGNDPHLSADGMALPTTFLYDKNGKLAKKYTGMILESTLKSDIELLLGEK